MWPVVPDEQGAYEFDTTIDMNDNTDEKLNSMPMNLRCQLRATPQEDDLVELSGTLTTDS